MINWKLLISSKCTNFRYAGQSLLKNQLICDTPCTFFALKTLRSPGHKRDGKIASLYKFVRFFTSSYPYKNRPPYRYRGLNSSFVDAIDYTMWKRVKNNASSRHLLDYSIGTLAWINEPIFNWSDCDLKWPKSKYWWAISRFLLRVFEI